MDSNVIPNMRDMFYERLDTDEVGQRENSNAVFLTRETHTEIVATLERLQTEGEKMKCRRDYRLKSKYYVILSDFDGIKKIVRKGTDTVLVAKEDLFDVIHEAHIKTDHSGRDTTHKELRRSFYNVTVRSINIYLRLCEECRLSPKKAIKRKKATAMHKKKKKKTGQEDKMTQTEIEYLKSGAGSWNLEYLDFIQNQTETGFDEENHASPGRTDTIEIKLLQAQLEHERCCRMLAEKELSELLQAQLQHERSRRMLAEKKLSELKEMMKAHSKDGAYETHCTWK